jgi:hypothetical protein
VRVEGGKRVSESMPERPLIVLPEPGIAERLPLGGGQPGGSLRRPTAAEQGRRLGPKLQALQRAMELQTQHLAREVSGADPELVLVLEIIGSVDNFLNAVSKIEGFEYLAEIEEEDIEGDDAFVDLDEPTRTFDGMLFLLMANQEALGQLLNLWQRYVEDPEVRLPYGLGRWKQVFGLLRDIRQWGPEDRLRGTGILEDFVRRAAEGQETVSAEVELWFRQDAGVRQSAEQVVRAAVGESSGTVLAQAVIPQISYHALLVELPIDSISGLLQEEREYISLVRAEEVAFVRPEAQALVVTPRETTDEPLRVDKPSLPSGDPHVALLDGVPLAGHETLEDRLRLDDPDGFESRVAAADRRHGTAMASLIIHGDVSAPAQALRNPIYVRPILLPDAPPWVQDATERIPHGVLAVDLVHRAVVRIFEGEAGAGAVAPSVKVINLSVGDASNPLTTVLSPWARLIDWLSWRYQVLFIISTGNYDRRIELPFTRDELDSATDDEVRSSTLKVITDDALNRRLCSPSEAVNALSVGAAHADEAPSFSLGLRRDLLAGGPDYSDGLPSPMTAMGMGYRRAIKPDLLAPGGRLLFREVFGSTASGYVAFDPSYGALPPGLKVAVPNSEGGLSSTTFFRGTSGSAAWVSRAAALVIQDLETLSDPSGLPLDSDFFAVMAKTLIVHTASWGSAAQEIRKVVASLWAGEKLKDAVSRLVGYGCLDPARLGVGTDQRVTLLGFGRLADGEAHRYAIPLPPSLAGQRVWRRMAITLGYIPPINARDRRHRGAELFFRPERDSLRLYRQGPSWQSVKRGTLQHEVLESYEAAAFADGDVFDLQVNCRRIAGHLHDRIPYAVALSLEVEQATTLPIYEEVAMRLRAQIAARAQVRAPGL